MSASPAPTSRARRWGVFAGIVLGVVALYGVLGGLVLPYFGRTLAADKLSERWGRKVVIDDLSFNPYTLAASLKGFRIFEADGKTPFAGFDRMDLDGSILSIRRLAPVFDQVTLDGLKVNLVRETDTRYNVTDMLGRVSGEGGPLEFSLNNIRVRNGRLDFDDRPRAAKHQVTDIEIAIPFVSNLPIHLKEFVRPSFAAKLNGAGLSLAGESLPFEASHRTLVSIDLAALEVNRYAEYAPLPVRIDSGKLDARVSLRFTQATGKPPSIDIAGKLALRDLQVSSPTAGPLANADSIELDLASFDPLGGTLRATSLRVADLRAHHDAWRIPATEARDIRIDVGKKDVRIASVATSGGTLALKRRADGSLELPAGAAPSAEPAAPSSSWNVAIAKATLDGYTASLADTSVKPAATHRISITRLEAGELGTAKGTKSTLTAKVALGKDAGVDIDSTFSLDPLVLDARIDARRIDLVPIRPYAEHFKTVTLKSGNVSAMGRLALNGGGKAVRISYSGAAELADVATLDSVNREDLLNWASLRAKAIEFQWSRNGPLRLDIADVAVIKAYSRLVVLPDGKINLQQLMAATPGDPGAPAPPPRPGNAQARDIRIDRVTFAGSRLDFTDLFIRPNYKADVGALSGTVTNLSSDPATRAEVDLKGTYDKTAPVVITGTVNPLGGNLFVDIAAKGKDIELPRLTAYSQRYAGYGITKGKLTLDVKYHVEDGKMEGRNRIFIEQLTFGERVEGPDATKLPVLFAVNLLKNAKGEIDLELPVSGSLDDPQFKIGALISQVVVNLLKKAVTAPFSLIAAAFGGKSDGDAKDGGEDLAYVDFEPGRAEIGPGGQKKLDQLSRALLDRPAIRIEMAGHTDVEKDLQALKREALERRLKAANGNLKTVFEAEKIPRTATKDEKPREPTVAEMEALLLERVVVGEAELGALALQRSERVKGYLVEQGKMPAERVVVAAAPEKVSASRVAFKLQ